MGLLKKAENQTAYLKAGIMGFQGAGKTFTAGKIAIGLTHLVKGDKVAFFDTEKGSDFLVKPFKDAGVELLSVKSRAFTDLCAVIPEAEKLGASVLIIDSITHVWRDLCESYSARMRRKNGLYMQDWGVLKGQWQQFVTLYLNSKIHILMLGRAGYEYDFAENEGTGKNEVVRGGTKMKVEGETGFEPDLLLEMTRAKIEVNNEKKHVHRCTVLKDRCDLIDGHTFDNPTFENFLPVIQYLNIGGDHVGIDTTRNSQHIFEDPDYSYEEFKKQRDIALDRLSETLVLAGLDGSAAKTKEERLKTLIEAFGTSSKTEIESMKPSQIREAIDKIREKYRDKFEVAPKTEAPNEQAEAF